MPAIPVLTPQGHGFSRVFRWHGPLLQRLSRRENRKARR